jgi:outer membrane protein assembly factor BamE (lipoprotein component of BamABCDE complex)
MPRLSFLSYRIALVAAAAALASACTPTSSFQGFQAVEGSPADVKVGKDTRSAVLARLGSPTATATLDKDTWFYLSQAATKSGFYKPRLTRRDVIAISFAKGGDAVADVKVYALKDGRVIAYSKRETPTRGREMSIIEQLLGSISAAGALPNDQDNAPGQHGPGR